jgi:hypothetical protein
MSERLDDLARSMAKAMPRRRALRLLGGALLSTALPGLGPTTARAARAATCTSGEFKCKCPNLDLFYEVCCPDTTPPTYECVCKAPPQGYAACKPLKKKVCGPDISDALADALSRTRAKFASWSSTQRAVACVALVETPIGAVGWEINQLGPGNREDGAKNFQPACATCTKSLSVQVGGGCHYAGSANYVVYGAMLRLCHDHFKSSSNATLKRDAPFFSEQQMVSYIALWKRLREAPNLTPSTEWAKAGYNGWPNGPTPAPELPNCAPCPKRVTSRLTVRWLPLGLNI